MVPDRVGHQAGAFRRLSSKSGAVLPSCYARVQLRVRWEWQSTPVAALIAGKSGLVPPDVWLLTLKLTGCLNKIMRRGQYYPRP